MMTTVATGGVAAVAVAALQSTSLASLEAIPLMSSLTGHFTVYILYIILSHACMKVLAHSAVVWIAIAVQYQNIMCTAAPLFFLYNSHCCMSLCSLLQQQCCSIEALPFSVRAIQCYTN
jgi:hypothetical protein